MVAEEDDERLALELQLVQLRHEVAEPVVGRRQLRAIEGRQRRQVRAAQPARGREAVQDRPRLPRTRQVAAVELDVSVRRIPRLVRVEAVEHERPRLLLPRALGQQPHPRSEDARREVVLLAAPPLLVGEVLAHLLSRARREDLRRHPVRELGVRDPARVVRDRARLPLDRDESVVGVAVGLLRADQHPRRVGRARGPVAGASERADHVRGRHVLPAGRRRHVLRRAPAAERIEPAAAEDRRARRPGREGLGIVAREAQRLARERVEARGVGVAAAERAERVGAHAVDDHQQQVRDLALPDRRRRDRGGGRDRRDRLARGRAGGRLGVAATGGETEHPETGCADAGTAQQLSSIDLVHRASGFVARSVGSAYGTRWRPDGCGSRPVRRRWRRSAGSAAA